VGSAHADDEWFDRHHPPVELGRERLNPHPDDRGVDVASGNHDLRLAARVNCSSSATATR
jgi:hypothetical protein